MNNYKQVIILFHEKKREINICKMMKQCIDESGIADEVIIGDVYDVMHRLYEYKPDLVISILPRDEHSTSIFTLAKIVWKCFWVAVPTEGFFVLSDESIHKLIGFNETPNTLVDKYMFWGEGTANAAKKQLKKYDKILDDNQVDSFGYLPYEKQMIADYRRDTKCSKQIAEKSKQYSKSVMFVLAHMARPLEMDDYLAESCIDTNNTEEIEKLKKRVNANKYYCEKYIEIIRQSALSCPDILFLVRKHPVEDAYLRGYDGPTRYDRIKGIDNIVMIEGEEPISNFFAYTDLLVNYGSTTAMEAYIYRIPVIQLLNDHPDASVLSYGYRYPAQVYFVISDFNNFISSLKSNIGFVVTDVMEDELKLLVNYSSHTDYCPSSKFVHILETMPDKPLRIEPRNQITKHVLKSSEYKQWIKSLLIQTLRQIKRFKLSNALRGIKIVLEAQTHRIFA